MIRRIINELVYTGLSREEYRSVLKDVENSNRKSVIEWSVAATFIWVFSLVLSLNQYSYKLCRMAYFFALVVTLINLVMVCFWGKQSRIIKYLGMYILELTILGAGLSIALLQPDVRTVTMIVGVIIVPINFISRSISSVILLTLYYIVYMISGKNVIVPNVYSWGLINLFIFSVIGFLLGHVMNKARFERYLFALQAKKLADLQTQFAYYDQMTGLKNRRAYSEEIDRYKESFPENSCVIMADINGLKAANDQQGHEAGDELIIEASRCLCEAFPGVDRIYRIGGDEFCVILISNAERALECLQKLDQIAAARKGRYIHGVSISYGIGTPEDGPTIEDILKAGDRKMYEHKRNWYQQSGHDRRRRRDIRPPCPGTASPS